VNTEGGDCRVEYYVIGLAVILVATIIGMSIYAKSMFDKGVEHRKKFSEAEIGSAEAKAEKLIAEAIKTSESKKRENLLEVKEEIHKSRMELDKEIKDRRIEIQRLERRLVQKEESLDKKIENLEQKDEALVVKAQEVEDLHQKTIEIQKKQFLELERISGFSVDEAKDYLLKSLENEVKHESAILIKDIESRAKEEADKKSKKYYSVCNTKICS
jgi:ribonuclease Y